MSSPPVRVLNVVLQCKDSQSSTGSNNRNFFSKAPCASSINAHFNNLQGCVMSPGMYYFIPSWVVACRDQRSVQLSNAVSLARRLKGTGTWY